MCEPGVSNYPVLLVFNFSYLDLFYLQSGYWSTWQCLRKWRCDVVTEQGPRWQEHIGGSTLGKPRGEHCRGKIAMVLVILRSDQIPRSRYQGTQGEMCFVAFSPVPNISWYLDDHVLQPDPMVSSGSYPLAPAQQCFLHKEASQLKGCQKCRQGVGGMSQSCLVSEDWSRSWLAFASDQEILCMQPNAKLSRHSCLQIYQVKCDEKWSLIGSPVKCGAAPFPRR